MFRFSRVGGSVSIARALSFLAVVSIGFAQQSTVPRSREVTDAGRFFAGLPGEACGAFGRFEGNPAWMEHQRRLDSAWAKAETGLIGGVRDFQKQELGRAAPANSNVFYPFGLGGCLEGDDVFSAESNVCDRGAGAGRHCAHRVTTRKKRHVEIPRGPARDHGFGAGPKFLHSRNGSSVRGQVTDGLLVPILHLLARTQHTVLGFRYVRLADDGA